MTYMVTLSSDAVADIEKLKKTPHLEKRFKAVSKALLFLASNPKHPGLQTHGFSSLKGPQGQKVFEAYAEQNTPGAYRIFFYYGKTKWQIIIMAVTPHP